MKKLSNRAVSHLLAAATFGVAAPLHAAAQDAGASSANSLASVEAIVVTAQRRAENVQKLSTPIAVLSGQDISRAGVTQPQDLNTVTPGLQLGMSGTTAQPYIRGVGNADNTGFAVSGVAFNVDGVYIAQPIAYGVSLFDLDRLEVLKGPQGTLYGRNATGGAINIITKQPSSQFGGYVGVDVNNYGLANVNGAVNLPVSDKIAVRAAFQIDDRNGYFKDGTNDDRSQKGRIRVKLTPTEDLTMLLNFEASHVGGAGPGGAEDIGASYNILRPWAGTLAPATVAAGYVTSNDTATRPFVDQNEYRINGELTWQANNFSFTLIPAYSHVSLVGINYADSFKLQTVSNTYDEKSIEGRVGYESDKLKWVFGLYYFDQHQTVNFTVDYHVLGITSSNPKINTESYAAFTQGTYSLTGSLRAIGGVRYSHEDQAGYGVKTYPFGGPPTPTPYASDVKSSSVDYRVGLEYDLTPINMLYATVSSGYKAGGWFPSPVGPLGGNTFLPEHLTAFEIGSRNQFFDRKLQVNLEGFYWLYHNKQETFTGYNGLGLPDNITANADKATSRGVDADIVWKPTPNDRITANGEYLDAVYNKFSYVSPFPGTTACGQSATIFNGLPGILVNCGGLQMSRSPKWSGSAGYDHILNLGGAMGTLDAAVNVVFGADRWLAASYQPALHAPAYAEENVFLTYTTPDQRWSVTGYVRNLSNAVVAASGRPNALVANLASVSLNPPRTYGVQLKAKF